MPVEDEIYGGNNDGDPTHFDNSCGVVQQVSAGLNLDEEICLATTGNTDVRRCRVEEVSTDMVELEGTIAADEVDITKAMMYIN